MSTRMTKAVREAFLAEVRVAVISIPESGRGPLTVPVWYSYTPGGEVLVWTGGNSQKAKLLRQAGRFSLCVQKDSEPYQYVSVEGPITRIGPIDFETELRPLVYRYMGQEAGDQFIASLGGDAPPGTGDIVVRMRPERWLTADYS